MGFRIQGSLIFNVLTEDTVPFTCCLGRG